MAIANAMEAGEAVCGAAGLAPHVAALTALAAVQCVLHAAGLRNCASMIERCKKLHHYERRPAEHAWRVSSLITFTYIPPGV